MAYTYSDFLKKAQATNTLKDFDPDELRLAEPYPEYGIAAASLKAEANSATTSAQRAIANEAAAQLKASYNGFTGSYQDEIDDILDQLDKYPDFSYDQEAPEYDNKYEEEQDAILDQIGKYPDFSWDQEAPTYTNPYEQLQKELLDQLLNREDFTWSTDTDPVFGQYQKQYLREGERATANALAQAAAASGGQTSSYAATAASQAGNYYASQLSDMIPELYNQAYQRYLSEYEQLANDLGVVNTQQQLDYKEYLDRLEGKVEQMRSLADHLFRYALSSGETSAGHTEAVTLEAGVGDALSELAACLTQRGFQVKADLPWDDRQVAVDCEGAARVLDNLTSNLLKYADPRAPVTISLLEGKDRAGIRIANALRPSADGAESSGVGLASASRVMEQMGGRLDREETDDGFQVTLFFRYV